MPTSSFFNVAKIDVEGQGNRKGTKMLRLRSLHKFTLGVAVALGALAYFDAIVVRLIRLFALRIRIALRGIVTTAVALAVPVKAVPAAIPDSLRSRLLRV